MKRKENEAGVPRKKSDVIKKVLIFTAVSAMFTASAAVGYVTAPEETRLPVLLADGEVIMQPCYVAVDGQCVAVVEDEAEAEKAVALVKDEYKNVSTVQVEIEENTSIGNMELKNGDEKPEIMTAEQAGAKILETKSVTVKTTEMIEEEQPVEYKTIEKVSDELDPGEIKISQEGQAGINFITKEVIKENGVVISENILDEQIVKESVPEIIISGTARFELPLNEIRVTSGFGERWGRQHQGVDLGAPEGTPVLAAGRGSVTCAEYRDGFGNLVIIDHGEGVETYYAHCSRLDVLPGQQVENGWQVAAVGSTGNSTGPHLHFEVRIDGVAQDPAAWIDLNGM